MCFARNKRWPNLESYKVPQKASHSLIFMDVKGIQQNLLVVHVNKIKKNKMGIGE